MLNFVHLGHHLYTVVLSVVIYMHTHVRITYHFGYVVRFPVYCHVKYLCPDDSILYGGKLWRQGNLANLLSNSHWQKIIW